MRKEKIKSWYIKEYPDDELGQEIKDDVTFEDIFNLLTSTEYYNDDYNEDFYDYISNNPYGIDSTVRERIFRELAELYNVSYEDVYDAWLRTIPNGLLKAKRNLNKAFK